MRRGLQASGLPSGGFMNRGILNLLLDTVAAALLTACSFTLRLTHRLAHRLVFANLRAALGGAACALRCRGGAPLAPELAEFFHAAGLLILEGYGLIGTCPVLTFNRSDHFKF